LSILLPARAQYLAPDSKKFTHQDSLRGSITPERAWWDLKYYHLDIAVKPSDSTIYGTNTVTYRVIKSSDIMQIDLQPPLEILKAEQDGKQLNLEREGNVYWVRMAEKQEPGQVYSVVINYGGRPKSPAGPHGKEGLHGQRIGTICHLWLLHVRATEPASGGHARIICMMNRTAC
jgi:hypothetical protein